MSDNALSKTKLTKNLSPLGAWAFAIGTGVGWGSLVVTNNSYLGQAGPLGSVIGMVIGAVIMLIISRNYAYLMNAYPDSGGMADYEPAKTENFKAVFEQADTLMYEEKKALKNMGAATRL